jgi:hypothetical protein
MTFVLALFMAALGAALLAYGAPGVGDPKQQFLFEMGIAALSAGFVGVAYDSVVRRDFLNQVKEELEKILYGDALRLGVKRIYETRTSKIKDEKLDLSQLLEQSKAKTEIMFVALGLHTIIWSYRRQLSDALDNNATIKFIIFNSEGPNAGILDQTLGEPNLADTLKPSLSAVRTFAKDHKDKKVEVRLLEFVPTFGAIAVNRTKDDSTLIIELNSYGLPGEDCPSLWLQKKPGGLYDTYNEQITKLWNAATPVQL